MFMAARKYLTCNDMRAKRVTFLVKSYETRFWYFESIDMLRKFLLASMVVVVAPNSRVQLWFGLLASVCFAIVYVRCGP